MKTIPSAENPFGADRYGYLWEALRPRRRGRHLDFGAYDGAVLRRLLTTGVIEEGIGVDVNRSSLSSSALGQEGMSLVSIGKGEQLPFPERHFDSISILDVIEHIHDQKRVLDEMRRVLKDDGIMIITVPRKHVFSFLDLGNLKFRFPRAHRIFFTLLNSREEYKRRYVDCENGLFGDIEVEKMWHQHFSLSDMRELVGSCGFALKEADGSGLFKRVVFPITLLSPFLHKAIWGPLENLDARLFAACNLFCLVQKKEGDG